MRGLLVGVLAGAAICVSAAGAAGSAPAVLATRDATLKPSGVGIRLVVSRVAARRVTVLLALYRRVGPLGYRRVKQVVVARGMKRTGRVMQLTVKSRANNAAAVKIVWRISPAAGKRTYSYVASSRRIKRA